MQYEELKKANETIATMTIEKKDKKTGEVIKKEYAEVNQRIKAFRMVFPDGFIKTDLLSNDGGVAIFRARVGYYGTDDKEIILGTGTAYEKEGSSFINSTSYIENCETSAVGRALGMLGFGIDTSVASYEEVQNAKLNQDQKQPEEKAKEERKASPKQVELIRKAYGENLGKLLDALGVETAEDIPLKKASDIISAVMKKGGKE